MAALMRFTITVPAQIIQVFLGIVKIILMNHGKAKQPPQTQIKYSIALAIALYSKKLFP